MAGKVCYPEQREQRSQHIPSNHCCPRRETELRPCYGSLAILLLILAPALVDAQVARSELENRYQKKQASAFLKNAIWERTLDAAKERARRDNLPIVAYFTRSYSP